MVMDRQNTFIVIEFDILFVHGYLFISFIPINLEDYVILIINLMVGLRGIIIVIVTKKQHKYLRVAISKSTDPQQTDSGSCD